MTWWEAKEIFDYWRESPPTHELVAAYMGYEKPLTTEEKINSGAMSPADFLQHAKRTGGKVQG